jgi:Ni,Fe-hydrogenase I large subunit
MDFQSLKKLLTATNLYYTAGVIAIIFSMLFLGLVFADQSSKNTQASLILSDAEGITTTIQNQKKAIETQSKNHFSIIPQNMASIISSEFNSNDFTRYLEDLEIQYKANGVFSINSINYTSQTLSQDFIDATINVSTSQDNLLKFLELVEKSGFSQDEPPYLLEVQSINFVVPEAVIEDSTAESENQFSFSNILNPSTNNLVYSVTLQLKVYRFQSNLPE